MKVLICDHHTIFADSLAHLLSSSGMDVAAVTYTPDAAIDALTTMHIDICSLDVMFADISVLDRLGEIRRASTKTRYVVLASALDARTVSAGRAAGMSGFADKSRSAAEIIATFHKVSAGHLVIPGTLHRVPLPRQAGSEPTQPSRRLASCLTPRERQVLSALVGGSDTTALARQLGISPATARCHIQSLLMKMNVHSRLEAATTAVRLGLLDPENGDWRV